MPAKRKKFESTFPAARIKRIMQLDDDIGRVASSVPIVISRALEIFLHSVLTRANQFAVSRSAKTLTVGHLKHCIEHEKQLDFLKDLTAQVPEVNISEEMQGPPKRGRKRRTSGSSASKAVRARKAKDNDEGDETGGDEDEEGSDSEEGSDNTSSASSPHGHNHPTATSSSVSPSPLAALQQQIVSTAPPPAAKSLASSKSSTAQSSQSVLSPLAVYAATLSQGNPASKPTPLNAPTKPSPLLAYTSKLQTATPTQSANIQPSTSSTDGGGQVTSQTMEKIASLVKPHNDSSEDDYDE